MLDRNGDDLPLCERCEHYHIRGEKEGGARLCPAHVTDPDSPRYGLPCGHTEGWGTPNSTGQCRKHGGSTLAAAKSAEKQAAIRLEKETRKLLAIEGYEGNFSDPFSELLLLASEMKKLKSVLLEKVEELETLRTKGGAAIGETVDIYFGAYERAIERCERITLGMARLDLTARIAQMNSAIDSAMADMVKSALAGALDTLPISTEDRESCLRVFGSLLREQPAAESALRTPQIAAGGAEILDVGPDEWEENSGG